MGNGFMGQILGSVLGGARMRQQPPMAGPGGLGDLLGGVFGGATPMGRGGAGLPMGRSAPGAGNRGMLLALLLPLAMQWVQRNGGIGAVLDRVRQRGHAQEADSWVSTGPNRELAPRQVGELVGHDELSRMSQQLGVGDEEVATGLSEILPQLVDQSTPDGRLPPDADQVLDRGRLSLEQALEQLRAH